MATAYLIHSGRTLPEGFLDAAAPLVDGYSTIYKTAELGPEATVGTPSPDRVVTDVAKIAEFWDDRGADVKTIGAGLPEWMPKADQLEAAGYTSVDDVRKAARVDILGEVKGIGDAYVERIKDALEEHA